jgi:hypothetical protein
MSRERGGPEEGPGEGRSASALAGRVLRLASLLVLLAVYAAATASPRPRNGADEAPRTDRLAISAGASGLAPGVSVPLAVRLRNGYGFAIRVGDIRVRAGDARPGCPAAALDVGRTGGRTRVPAGGSRTVRIPAALDATAPDACQDARFPLRLRARGTR